MNQPKVRMKLYRAILFVGAFLSVISIVGNVISGYPFFLTSIKWVFLFIVAIIALIFSKTPEKTARIMFWIFIFLVFVFLPFAFFNSGGSSNNSIGYTFLLIISIAYLFNGRKRMFLAVALIVVFALLHTLEYLFPQLVTIYPERTQFIDRLIQTPVMLLATFLITLKFTNEYERINRKLNYLANFDELTGLYNRRMFDKAAAEIPVDDDKSAHLALIDLDNFKKVNDKFGHHIGDEVLKELSSLLKKNFGLGKNVVSRWGGDEFAIIYYGDKEEMVRRLEDVRKAFLTYASYREKTLGLSVSIVSFDDYEKASQTFVAADRQLYKEKSRKSF